MVEIVKKRSGRLDDFNPSKIHHTIFKALRETKKNGDEELLAITRDITGQVVKKLESTEKVINVKLIVSTVQDVLIKNNYRDTARALRKF